MAAVPFSRELLTKYLAHEHVRDRECTSSDLYRLLVVDEKNKKVKTERAVGCPSCAADARCRKRFARFAADLRVEFLVKAEPVQYRAALAWVQSDCCGVAFKAVDGNARPAVQLVYLDQQPRPDHLLAFVRQLGQWPGQALWQDLDGYCRDGWYFWHSWGAAGAVWDPRLLPAYLQHQCQPPGPPAAKKKKLSARERACVNLPVSLRKQLDLSLRLADGSQKTCVAHSACVLDGEMVLNCREDDGKATLVPCRDLTAAQLVGLGAVQLSQQDQRCANRSKFWASWPRNFKPLGECPHVFGAALEEFLRHPRTAQCGRQCQERVLVSLPPRRGEIKLRAYRAADGTAALEITLKGDTVDAYEFLRSEGNVDRGLYWLQYIDLASAYDANDWPGFLQCCPPAQKLVQTLEALVEAQKLQRIQRLHGDLLAQRYGDMIEDYERWSPIEITAREEAPLYNRRLLDAYRDHKHLVEPVCAGHDPNRYTLRRVTDARQVQAFEQLCCRRCAAERKCGTFFLAEFAPKLEFEYKGHGYRAWGVVVKDRRCFLIATSNAGELALSLRPNVEDNPADLYDVLRAIRRMPSERLWQDLPLYCSAAHDFWSSWGTPRVPWDERLLGAYAEHQHPAVADEPEGPRLCRTLGALLDDEPVLRLRVQPGVGAAEEVRVLGARVLSAGGDVFDVEFTGQRDGKPLLAFRYQDIAPEQLVELNQVRWANLEAYCRAGSLFWNSWRRSAVRGPAYNEFQARLTSFLAHDECRKLGCRNRMFVATPLLGVPVGLRLEAKQPFQITLDGQPLSVEQFLSDEKYWRRYIELSRQYEGGAWMHVPAYCREQGLPLVRGLERLIRQARDLPYQSVLEEDSGGAQPRDYMVDVDYEWDGLED